MKIAVAKEQDPAEPRVAATPDTVKKYKALGAEVAVEPGAGIKSGIPDAEYTAMGATVSHDGADLTVAMDGEIEGIIRRVYREHGYIVDPHTACGFKELNPDRVSVVLSTAHPAKFPDAIKAATGVDSTHPALEALKSRPVVGQSNLR